MSNFWKSGVAAAAIAGFGGVAMAAGVTLDGKVNESEYSYKWSVAPADLAAPPDNMLVYMYQDSAKHLFVGIVLPKDYVDNTYGTKAVGWSKGHTFDDLLGSDRMDNTQFAVGGSTKVDINIDYMALLGTGGTYYGSAGITANGGTTGTGVVVDSKSDGLVTSGSPITYFNSKSSMDYNWGISTAAQRSTYFGSGTNSPNASSADYSGSAVSGWEFACMYEFEIYDDWIGSNTFDFSTMKLGTSAFSIVFAGEGVHASPSKVAGFGGTSITGGGTPTNGTPVVPLPASVWMGGLTLAGILGRRHLKRRKASELS